MAATGRRVTVGFNYRYSPRNSRVRQLLRDDAISSQPYSELRARANSALRDIAAAHDGAAVLVVSHGNTLRSLVKLVDGVSDADSSAAPASAFILLS